jgi:hypothetical protein
MSIELAKGEVIIAVRPSLFRRAVAAIAMVAAAGLLISAALQGAGPFWQSLLVMMGLGMCYLAWRFWQATAVGLELTREALRDSDGRLLFAVADVQRIDRGIFAMKPTNGLTIHLTRAAEPAWQPGLWWRLGKRVGIGGVTAPSQARAIADTLALLEAERDSAGSGI